MKAKQLVAILGKIIAAKGDVDVYVNSGDMGYDVAGEVRSLDRMDSAHLVARGTPTFGGWARAAHIIYSEDGSATGGGVS